MHLPFCYQVTHPTIALIMMTLQKGNFTAEQLAKRLHLGVSHVRNACDWMHRKQLCRVTDWVVVGRSRTRVFGSYNGDPDIPKPLNKRKRGAAQHIDRRRREYRQRLRLKEEELLRAGASPLEGK